MKSEKDANEKYFKIVQPYTYYKNTPEYDPVLELIGYINVNTGKWQKESSKFAIFFHGAFYRYCDIEEDNIKLSVPFCSIVGLLDHYKSTYM